MKFLLFHARLVPVTVVIQLLSQRRGNASFPNTVVTLAPMAAKTKKGINKLSLLSKLSYYIMLDVSLSSIYR